ncbi:MAG: serine/threonine-protein kinase [Myxococcota bacterium]
MPSPPTQIHLDEQRALDWLEGRMPSDQREAAMRHVDGCAACRRLLAVVAQAIDDDAPDESEGIAEGALVGRYRIERAIGSGAMGWVYRAHDPQLKRSVAIKLVRHPAVSIARVRAEGQALAQLSHPNVVTVLAAGDSDAGPWIAMEFVDGWTLGAWASARSPGVHARADALRSAAAGLYAAHTAGIVHGDFKPANVLVGKDTRVRVADFGLAKARRDAQPSARRASDGSHDPATDPWGASTLGRSGIGGPAGTPLYMAPEVLRGGSPTARSDQFSFCVAAWELLVGTRPFSGTTSAQLLDAIERGPPDEGRAALPGPWRNAILRGLRCAPERRHRDMRSLIASITPAPSGFRLRTWALGAAAALAVVWGFRTADRDPCPDANRVDTVVSEPRLQSAVRGLSADDGVSTAAADTLRTWATQWRGHRRAACGAGRRNAARCLDDALAEVDGRMHALAEGDVPTAGPLASIPDLDDCAITTWHAPPLEDPRLARLWRDLHVARGRYAHRRAEASRRAFTELARRADELGDPRLQSGVRFSLGRIHYGLGDRVAAKRDYEAAYFHAIDADAPSMATDAATGAAQVTAYLFSAYDDADIWLDHARSHLPRGEPTADHAELDMIHAEILQTSGRVSEANERIQVALSTMPPDAKLRLRASVHGTAGNVAMASGEAERAIAYYERAVALHGERGPAGDVDLPRPLNGLGAALASLGRYDEAAEHWTRASRLLSPGALREDRMLFEVNLGALRSMQGDDAAALQHYEAACPQLLELEVGPEPSSCFHNMALSLLRLERWPESAAAARKAIDTALGADPPMIAKTTSPLSNLGMALAEMGDFDGAVSAYRRSIAARHEVLASGPVNASEVRNGIAKAGIDLVETLLEAGRPEAAREAATGLPRQIAALTDTEKRAALAERLEALAVPGPR